MSALKTGELKFGTVTKRALLARINRKLSHDYEQVYKYRHNQQPCGENRWVIPPPVKPRNAKAGAVSLLSYVILPQ